MSSPAVLKKISAHSFLLLVAVSFCFSHTNGAIAQQTGDPEADPSTPAFEAKPADRTSASRDSRTPANAWAPDVDRFVPEVTPGTTCPLSSVLSAAGKKVEELARNV